MHLSVSATDTDHAGGTLAAATNIGNLFGRTQLADTVSASGQTDFYKFSLLNGGTSPRPSRDRREHGCRPRR